MLSVNVGPVTFILLSSLSILVQAEIVDHRPLKYGHAHNKPDSAVLKVTLTQKGYIQFLQYIANVPVMTEFTFCIWLKSVNFTYPHPLLSYSRRNTERLVRSWVTPGGSNLNLEILENEIFSVPVELKEHRWYHLCQSWMASTGVWMAFVDGQVKGMGISQKMHSVKIPKGGDVVVGQEYTDADKGLDDGIEGHIYGFNLVLAAASSITTPLTIAEKPPSIYPLQNDLGLRRQTQVKPFSYLKRPVNVYRRVPQFTSRTYEVNFDTTSIPPRGTFQPTTEQADVPEVLSYFGLKTRHPKAPLDFDKGINLNVFEREKPVVLEKQSALGDIQQTDNYAPRHGRYFKDVYTPLNSQQSYLPRRPFNANSRILQPDIGLHSTPLGLLLVELGYNNCALGKGSPINDKRLLISWTKTPVRVFGGAVLKREAPFCTRDTFRAS